MVNFFKHCLIFKIIDLTFFLLCRAKQAHNSQIETVPFRESKLTHIFKSYLTSATHICMIVNVNPDPSVAESTLQVLQNSAIASNVSSNTILLTVWFNDNLRSYYMQ